MFLINDSNLITYWFILFDKVNVKPGLYKASKVLNARKNVRNVVSSTNKICFSLFNILTCFLRDTVCLLIHLKGYTFWHSVTKEIYFQVYKIFFRRKSFLFSPKICIIVMSSLRCQRLFWDHISNVENHMIECQFVLLQPNSYDKTYFICTYATFSLSC